MTFEEFQATKRHDPAYDAEDGCEPFEANIYSGPFGLVFIELDADGSAYFLWEMDFYEGTPEEMEELLFRLVTAAEVL